MAVKPGLRSSFARREQPGSILVLTALMMVVLLGFVGLVIDVGHRMDVYRQTQNAADAAALAAAYSLSISYPGGSPPSSVSPSATAAAQLMVQQNGFSSPSALQPLAFVACPATSHSWAICVQASVSSTFPNFFISVLGFGQSSVGSKAVAEVYNDGGLGGLVQ